MNTRVATAAVIQRARYLEPAIPLVFPEEAEVPETQLHLELRTLLYQLLSDYLGLEATVGSDQFLYYAADDPRQCLAPDVYAKLTPRGEDISVWKTWERGAPEVAVEIVSDSDTAELPWQEKLARYARIGVKEVVRFNGSAPPGRRLRIWNRVNERLRERSSNGEQVPSLVLGLTWVVAATGPRPVTLRIAVDEAGQQLVPTHQEARKAEEQARKAEEQARKAEEQARKAEEQARKAAESRALAAEQRLAELEAELRRRS